MIKVFATRDHSYGTLFMLNAIVMIWRMNAPRTVPIIFALPPVILVSPMATAAIAVSSRPLPMVSGSAAPALAMVRIPAQALISPLNT